MKYHITETDHNKYLEVKEFLAIKIVNIVLTSKYNHFTEALINKLLFELKQYVSVNNLEKSNTTNKKIQKFYNSSMQELS